jgi:hypothetical protein
MKWTTNSALTTRRPLCGALCEVLLVSSATTISLQRLEIVHLVERTQSQRSQDSGKRGQPRLLSRRFGSPQSSFRRLQVRQDSFLDRFVLNVFRISDSGHALQYPAIHAFADHLLHPFNLA